MKVVFSGPSLDPALRLDVSGGVTHRGPAACGDVLRAVEGGACAIGLIDGVFGTVASVWHKEILHALSKGVRVVGGASMGALRAAECDAFGMVGLGRVYGLYRDGILLDDAAVAQIHAPTELGHVALSEAAVTVSATLDGLLAAGLVSAGEHAALLAASNACPFAERTMATVARRAAVLADRRAGIADLLEKHRIDVKRADAAAVLDWVRGQPASRTPAPTDWAFQSTSQFRALHSTLGRA